MSLGFDRKNPFRADQNMIDIEAIFLEAVEDIISLGGELSQSMPDLYFGIIIQPAALQCPPALNHVPETIKKYKPAGNDGSDQELKVYFGMVFLEKDNDGHQQYRLNDHANPVCFELNGHPVDLLKECLAWSHLLHIFRGKAPLLFSETGPQHLQHDDMYAKAGKYGGNRKSKPQTQHESPPVSDHGQNDNG